MNDKDRDKTRTTRLKKIIDKGNWETLPEEMKTGIVREFMGKFFSGVLK